MTGNSAYLLLSKPYDYDSSINFRSAKSYPDNILYFHETRNEGTQTQELPQVYV